MPWIETVPDENATGLLATLYKAASSRTGKVFNILRIQSVNPPVLRTGIGQYSEIMFGESPLTRVQREMIATVVSRANECHY